MNRRNGKKINHKRAWDVLNKIIDHGYSIRDVKFTDGFGKINAHAICKFHLYEFPDYVFGMWLWNNNDCRLFGQYEFWVDKFKPSRNEVSANNTLESFLEGLDFIRNNYIRFIADHYQFEEIHYTDESGIVVDVEEGWDHIEWDIVDITNEYINVKSHEEDYIDRVNTANREFSKLYSKDIFANFEYVSAVVVSRVFTYWDDLCLLVDTDISDDEYQKLYDYVHNRVCEINNLTYDYSGANCEVEVWVNDNHGYREKKKIIWFIRSLKKADRHRPTITVTRKDYERALKEG